MIAGNQLSKNTSVSDFKTHKEQPRIILRDNLDTEVKRVKSRNNSKNKSSSKSQMAASPVASHSSSRSKLQIPSHKGSNFEEDKTFGKFAEHNGSEKMHSTQKNFFSRRKKVRKLSKRNLNNSRIFDKSDLNMGLSVLHGKINQGQKMNSSFYNTSKNKSGVFK